MTYFTVFYMAFKVYYWQEQAPIILYYDSLRGETEKKPKEIQPPATVFESRYNRVSLPPQSALHCFIKSSSVAWDHTAMTSLPMTLVMVH